MDLIDKLISLLLNEDMNTFFFAHENFVKKLVEVGLVKKYQLAKLLDSIEKTTLGFEEDSNNSLKKLIVHSLVLKKLMKKSGRKYEP